MIKNLPKFYKSFSLIFFCVSVLSMISFLIFMTGHATVTITPEFQEVNTSLIVDIVENVPDIETKENLAVSGKVFEFIVEESKRFDATGQKDVESDVVGQVDIVNNYSKSQKLIETTRLLSESGVLLRMKGDIDIQPGERISVSVYPDDPKSFENLEPTKFTIPGLWEGLQPHIFAESTNTLTPGGYKVRFITQEDIQSAKAEVESLLDKKALSEFEAQLSDSQSLYSKLVQREQIFEEVTGKKEEQKDTFEVSLKMRAIVIAFDEVKLVNLVKKQITQGLGHGSSLKNVEASNLEYVVEKYDTEKKTAKVKVTAKGQSVIRLENDLLDAQQMRGMSSDKLRAALIENPEIRNVDIQLSPKWMKHLPRFSERIDVVIK